MKHDTPPQSAEILGALVDAFRLREFSGPYGLLTHETTRRFSRGHSVKDTTRARIIEEIAACFLRFLGISRGVDTLAALIEHHISPWDRFCAGMGGTAPLTTPWDVAVAAYLRRGIIDLALRMAAISAASALPPPGRLPETDRIIWDAGNCSGQFLRRTLEYFGTTRAAFADELGVSRTTVDRWLDHSRTPSGGLDRLAKWLAKRIEGMPAKDAERFIRFHYAQRRLLLFLAEHLGVEVVDELSRALWRLTGHAMACLSARAIPPAELSRDGCASELAIPVLECMRAAETDNLWRAEIAAARGPWSDRLREILAGGA